MPGLVSYQRIVIKGTGFGSEIWQTSFATTNTTPPTSQAALQSYLNTLVPFISTWWGSVRGLVYAGYAWTDVLAYHYNAPATTAAYQAEAVQTPVAGTLATGGAPVDTCCVVSLRTAVPGRRTRGRMYVPFHKAVAATNGQMNSADSNAVGTATKALFNSIISGSTGYPTVVSRTGNSYELVTGLVTDTKPDVQRRRENRMSPASTQVLALP